GDDGGIAGRSDAGLDPGFESHTLGQIDERTVLDGDDAADAIEGQGAVIFAGGPGRPRDRAVVAVARVIGDRVAAALVKRIGGHQAGEEIARLQLFEAEPYLLLEPGHGSSYLCSILRSTFATSCKAGTMTFSLGTRVGLSVRESFHPKGWHRGR